MKLLCAVLAAASCYAQAIQDLATNRDGSVLYFSSKLRQKGTRQYFNSKIFRWDAVQGIQLIEQREPELQTNPVFWLGTQYHSLIRPQVSADGVRFAYTAVRGCAGSAAVCVYGTELYQTKLYSGGSSPETHAGGAFLSRNGRFVALVSSRANPGRQSPLTPVRVMDRLTREVLEYPYWPVAGPRPIADDGTILLLAVGILGYQHVLGRHGQERSLPVMSEPQITSAGDAIVFRDAANDIRRYQIDSGRITRLVTAGRGWRFAISDDASVLVYPDQNSHLRLLRLDGRSNPIPPRFDEAIREVLLSGDGRVLFVLTERERLVRVDTEVGTSLEVVPPTATLTSFPTAVSPGAIVNQAGANFTTTFAFASPPVKELGGVRLLVEGEPVPIQSTGPNNIWYQVPWRVLNGPADLELHAANSEASPFVSGHTLTPPPPRFLTTLDTSGVMIAAAAHERFEGLVTSASPARPGEIIHLYAEGLGEVAPFPADSEPAPAAPLSVLVRPLKCSLIGEDESAVPIPVLFAGLAPGMFGVYQVDVRMPDVFAPAKFQPAHGLIRCDGPIGVQTRLQR